MTKKIFEYHKSKSQNGQPYQIMVELSYIKKHYNEIYQMDYAASLFSRRYGIVSIAVIDDSVKYTETYVQFTSYFNPTHHFTIPFNHIKQIYY